MEQDDRGEKQKQILRSAYRNCVGAPSCSAQDDTSFSKRTFADRALEPSRDCLEVWFAPGATAGGFYADAGAGFEFAGAFAGECFFGVVMNDGGLTNCAGIAAG